jgi:hypothetical protein
MFLNDGRLGDNHVLEAIVNMKEPKGSDKAAIATYIEVFMSTSLCVRACMRVFKLLCAVSLGK